MENDNGDYGAYLSFPDEQWGIKIENGKVGIELSGRAYISTEHWQGYLDELVISTRRYYEIRESFASLRKHILKDSPPYDSRLSDEIML